MGSGMRFRFLVGCFVYILAFTVSAQEAIELPIDVTKLTLQDPLGVDCGPAAIFNSFSMGKPELQASIAKIPGESVAEKFENFIQVVSQKPSEHFKGQTEIMRTNRNGGGTMPGDMRFILVDSVDLANLPAAQFYSGGYADRAHGEAFGRLALRIHSDIVRSLREGFPPVIARALYNGASRWNGHYVAVHAVSEIYIENSVPTFDIKTFDSITGTSQQWKVQEHEMFFQAYTWEIYSPQGQLVKPQPFASEPTLSPFLRMYPKDAAAKKSGEQEMINDVPMLHIILEQIFGRVEVPFYG